MMTYLETHVHYHQHKGFRNTSPLTKMFLDKKKRRLWCNEQSQILKRKKCMC